VKRIVLRVLAVVVGVLWGFFVAFNVVFSDVFVLGEMVVAVAVVLGAYAIPGAILGLFEPEYGWRWALWLAPPGVLLVLWQLGDAPQRWPYHLAVIVAIVAGSALPASASGSLRRVR
jgi:hypothetical protein